MYYLKLTQEEVNAYWLVLYYAVSERYQHIINNMVHCFGRYVSDYMLRTTQHEKFIKNPDIFEIKYLDFDYINDRCLKVIKNNYKTSYNHDEHKYLMCIDNNELILLNTVSNCVGGDPWETSREVISNDTNGVVIFNKLFGIRRFCDTGTCKGDIMFVSRV